MINFTKKSTGIFKSDCGNFLIEGACASLRGMRMRHYSLEYKDRFIGTGTLAGLKKRAALIARDNADELNGWEPVSQEEHEKMMQAERGMGSVL